MEGKSVVVASAFKQTDDTLQVKVRAELLKLRHFFGYPQDEVKGHGLQMMRWPPVSHAEAAYMLERAAELDLKLVKVDSFKILGG